jgi:hypothetical protein
VEFPAPDSLRYEFLRCAVHCFQSCSSVAGLDTLALDLMCKEWRTIYKSHVPRFEFPQKDDTVSIRKRDRCQIEGEPLTPADNLLARQL